MATPIVVVSFTYDLPLKDNISEQFKKVLEGLGWKYSLGELQLPNTTCITASDQKNEDEAVELAVAQIKEVIKKIREAGYSDFNVEKYFFLAHKVPSSAVAIGSNLL